MIYPKTTHHYITSRKVVLEFAHHRQKNNPGFLRKDLAYGERRPMTAWADNRNGWYMVLLFLARTHRDMRFRKDMARKYERINFGIYNEGNWRKKVCSQKKLG